MDNKKPESAHAWQFYTLYASMPQGWNPLEQFQIEGPNWKVNFRTSGPKIPYSRMTGDKSLYIKLDEHPGPCVEIFVDTNETDPEDALRLGSPIADILAGLLAHRLSTNIIYYKLWSGLKGVHTDNSTFLVTGEKFEAWNGAPLEILKQRAAEITSHDPFKIFSLNPRIAVSYRWFLKGLLERDNNDKFISLWLSVLVLFTSWCKDNKKEYKKWYETQTVKTDTEKNRIKYYIKDKLQLTDEDEQTFYNVLDRAYNLRNELVHEAKLDVITSNDIIQLARASGSILWIEMGYPFGGSKAILFKKQTSE